MRPASSILGRLVGTWLVVVVAAAAARFRRSREGDLNDRPIIGVIAQELRDPTPGVVGTSYIPAGYVKFLESAGARVVPIPTNMSDDEVASLFYKLNAVLLPGGSVTFGKSEYYRHAKIFFDMAVRAFDSGDLFPIWGTCLGLQTLAEIACGTDAIMSYSDSWDVSFPLVFTENANGSRMFANMAPELRAVLQNEPLTFNAHHNCVTPDSFRQYPKLGALFKILTVNDDLKGKTFVSTMEGHSYPFYGVQWHPEANGFEFCRNEGLGDGVVHSSNAIYAMQYFADFFVNEARKSRHRFKEPAEEEEYLIYKYSPYHSSPHGWWEEQIYIF